MVPISSSIPILKEIIENRRIRVSITARSASEWGASQMEVNYSSGRYRRIRMGAIQHYTCQFETYSFEYDVPATDAIAIGYDYLGGSSRGSRESKERWKSDLFNFKTLTPKNPQEG